MSNLNEQQMEAVDYVAVHGTLAAGLRIAKLQATITEIRTAAEFWKEWENKKGQYIEEHEHDVSKIQATITSQAGELDILRNGDEYVRMRKVIRDQQAIITKLTAALIYYADDPESYGDVAREALKENPE